jgi:parallel beta-helix repeat protein
MGISLTQEDLTTSFNPTSQTYTTLTLPSTGNTITENNIESNTNGVAIGYSTSYNSGSSNDVSGNTFYHNNFVNNTSQVTSVTSPTQAGSSQSPTGQPLTGQQPTASNSWDNGKEGNYWSDYKGTDSNHDGIGDTPYLVYTNNVDHYPLMTPFNTPTIGT